MKILGNGVDIIENKRIEKAIKNKVFIDKIFSNKEKKIALKKSKNKVNFFAKRFVAKEAFLKAIGTGLSGGLSFKDITINNNQKGKPFIELEKNIELFLKKKFKIKKYQVHLSISDVKKYSIAYVILCEGSK
tara:strand:- start:25 stop:420 length:396 start_codon:yes stop_codon:yes gene_type:complete